MTRVRWRDTQAYQQIDVDGHAEQTGPGEVGMICAGISAITQTLYANIQREEEKGQMRVDGENVKGNLWIRAWTTEENRAEIREMFRFTILGLKEIEKEYPENIEVKEERLNGSI